MSAPAAPSEFYDTEQSAPLAYLAESHTRNQVRSLIAKDWDLPYADIRVTKLWLRWDQDIVDEQIADGIEEPYDGWNGWISCSSSDPGAIAYWGSGDGLWEGPETYSGAVAA